MTDPAHDSAAARDDADRPEIAADDAGASALAEAAQKEVERDAAYQEGKGLGADPRHIVPAEGRQMDRSNDPAVTRDLDVSAPEAALRSRQRLTGSAVGVGSVGFDDTGAFDVGLDDHDPQDDPIVS